MGINIDTGEAIKEGMKLFRGASKLSISLALVVSTTFLGGGGVIWWNRETLIKIVELSSGIEHIQHAHKQCEAQLARITIRLEAQEKELQELKQARVAAQ